jgi:hypothetical protein
MLTKTIYSSGTISMNVASGAAINNLTGLNPFATASHDIGSSSLRWNNIYLANAPNVSSDRSLKQNITALDKTKYFNLIKSLQPSSYQLLSDPSKTSLGFIAQDIALQLASAEISDDVIVSSYTKYSYTVDENGELVVDPNVPGVEEYQMSYNDLIAPLVLYSQELPNNLFPTEDAVYDIGSPSLRYNNLYLTGSVITTSDLNQKTNIQQLGIEAATALISKLEPKLYNMIGRENVQRYGLLAQDVEKIMFECGMTGIVHKSSDGSYGLNYTELVPHLVAASQGLIQKNKILEEKMKHLEITLLEAMDLLKEVKRMKTKTNGFVSPRNTTK